MGGQLPGRPFMRSTQFNIRLSLELIEDMEQIASKLKINRNDWLKYKLAEMIAAEMKKIKKS